MFVWQKVTKSMSRNNIPDNTVSIYKDGRVVISKNLYTALSSPEAIEIFIDVQQKAIGFKESTLQDSDAYVVSLSKTGHPLIRAKTIFKLLSYEDIPSGSKDAHWDVAENMVVMQL